MIKKISAILPFLLLMSVIAPLDNYFIGRIYQPAPAFAQSALMLDDFALYSQKETRLDKIADSRGSVGSNGDIDIKKGVSGPLIGTLQAVGHIKNEAEIEIYGDVFTAQYIEDRGTLSVSGQKIENADLAPITLPTLSFSSAGPDLEVPEMSSMTIPPGSYGNLKVKKGAAILLSGGTYYFVKSEIDGSATVNLDVSGGAISINIVQRMKLGEDVDMQIVGGGPQDVLFNYIGTDEVDIEDRAVLRGILTAPSAKVVIDKGGRLEGTVRADSIHMAKGASFRHYAAGMEGRPPTADAGGYQTALAGGQVQLDGSGSSDPDGDAITYNWSFVSYPGGSNPVLSDPTAVMPTFTADLAGVYVIELSVHDGTYASLKDSAFITAVSEVLDVTDFVLYADDKIKIDEISGGAGHVGANRHVHIEKGPSGTITGDLRVLDNIKNDGEIIIDGDVATNSPIEDRGIFTVTGIRIENAGLSPRVLPSLSYSAEGPDIHVPELASQTLAPGSYGRVEVKRGATLIFTAGSYFMRELKTEDSAILIFEASDGGIELNVVKKLEIGQDVNLHVTGGGTRDVQINYAGKKEVEIEDRSVLRGTLVAPKAKVQFEKESRLEGAVYAKKIDLDHGVSFQFHANRPPVADTQTILTVEDTPASITLSGSDPDDDSLTFAVNPQPLHGTLAGTAPDLTYTPSENYSGADAFSFTVNDGTVDAAPATVSITVAAVNDAPVANAQNISLNEDESKAMVLTAFDVEDGALAYEIVVHPSNGTLSGEAPDLIYTPGGNYHGDDFFSFKANDGGLDSNTAAVSLTINPVNDAPVAAAGSDQTVFKGDTVSLNGGGSSDVDEDSLNYQWSFSSVPTGSTAALSDSSVVSPSFAPDLVGTYEVQLIVNDGNLDSASDTVVITANPRMVAVPNVVGQIQADAAAALIGANLTVGTISAAYSDTIPADHVISQAPAAGASVEEGTAVDLVISLGPESQIPTLSINASPAIIQQGESPTLSWNSTNADSVHIDNGIGLVNLNDSRNVSPEHTTVFTITASGPGGNASAAVTIEVQSDPEPQPEGSFGEQYEDLVPPDATVDQYDPDRFSLIIGKVKNSAGTAISDVSITIHSRPQYGSVVTDAQGDYSIPVEGGGTLTVVYRKEGLIAAQRKVYVPWNDIATTEAVVMIAEDPASTTLTFDGNPDTVVTAKSSDVTDESGTRAFTMILTGDNQAYLVDENGNDVQQLTTITTRATEYTTPESMPAKLPPTSGFTYCTELRVDGAERVRFAKPVTAWVDNFLELPVGLVVPVGYYDRDKGVWTPEENGLVVMLLDTDADDVVDALDADGDGQPDDLNGDQSFSDEVQGLNDSQRYAAGSTFWRAAIKHFSPSDWNLPLRTEQPSVPPNPKGGASADQGLDGGSGGGQVAGEKPSDGCQIASFVEQRGRIFHEDIPITGTDMTLHYASNRVAGYKPGVFTIPASGDTVPDTLVKIIAQLSVAGKDYEIELPAEANQIAQIEWDGLDHFGRPVSGTVIAHIRIGFAYKAFYTVPPNVARAFGLPGTSMLTIPARQPVILWQDSEVTVTRGEGTLAEGWSISSHHQLSPTDTSVLFKGDGTISRNNVAVIDTFAGKGQPSSQYYSGMGGPATEAQIPTPSSLAMDSEGNLYIFSSYLAGFQSWQSHILKVDTQGIVNELFYTRMRFYHGNMALDPQGNIYWSHYVVWGGGRGEGGCVTKRTPEGVETTVLGACASGEWSFSGIYFKGIHLDNQGNLYTASPELNQVLKRDTAGVVTAVAGNGTRGHGGDGGSAIQAQLFWPEDIYVDDDGNLYIAEHGQVRKVDPSGIITTVAGGGSYGPAGDGGPATEAYFQQVEALTMDAEGNLYFADGYHHSIRRVDNNGIISTVAGINYTVGGYGGYSGDGGAATNAKIAVPTDILIDPAGNLFIADLYNHRVRKVNPTAAVLKQAMDATDIAFAEESGIGYIMSSAGLHKKTTDIDTGITLNEFGYDAENNLISITDQFGDLTIIERDGNAVPTAVISPDGIRADLTIDADNHLTRVTYADGSYYEFQYTADGLMTLEIEPQGNQFGHAFDNRGRLTDVTDEEGGHWSYTRTADPNGDVRVEMTTGEHNVVSYLDNTDFSGVYTSNTTDSAGGQTMFNKSSDGLTANHSLACGMDLEYIYDVDPEYKFKVLSDMTESTPFGLDKVTRFNKTYGDTDANDIPDLITDTVTVNNKTTTFTHNTLQTQKAVTSPEGRTVTTLYNPNTLLTESASVPGLFDTSYGYDTRGRLTSISTNTRQSAFTYSSEGFLESVTDPENQTTSYSYDPVGRVTGISWPDSGFVGFTYDKNGNTTVLTNPVDIDHGFGFNSVNRNSSYQTPLSGSYGYIYDKDRRLIQTNFPSGKIIINDYADPSNPDDKSRLWQIQTPEGNIDFTYLCGTKVDSITKDTESITYGYDGKLVTSETLSGTSNQSLDYTYNNDFDVASFTYAGSTVNYAYDNDGLLTGEGSYLISRNVQNGLPETVSGGALSLGRSFNGYGEVDSQDFTIGSQNPTSWTLTRDNNGRITQKTETVDGVISNYLYTYDSMGRLLTVTKDGLLVEEYGYDLSGTRITETNTLRGIAAKSFSYSDEDHLLSAGSVTYAYDLDGFLTTKTDGSNITSYTYSSRGELLNVTLPDSTVVEYVHDPLGRRIAKKVDGAITEKYLWQGLTRLLAIYDGSDNLLLRFEYADSRMPVAMTSAGATYYLTYDQVGSLKAVADSSGSVVKLLTYDSFGNTIGDTNPTFAVPFGFAGGLHDRDTGLVRFGYRDYDPDIGRWTAKDPILFAGGDTDLYGYVLNDPINLVDPLGLLVTYHGVGATAGAGVGTEGDSVNFMSASGYTYKGSRRDGGSEQGIAGTIGGGRMVGIVAGIGYEAGFHFGDVEDFSGKGTAVGFSFLIFNIEATFDPCDNSWTGMNFGILKSIGLGAYAEETVTGRLPTRSWSK